MKKSSLFFVIFLLGISLIGCKSGVNAVPLNHEKQQLEAQQQVNETNEKSVINVVEGFGKKLQLVSLLAPKDMVKKSMEENYSDFVSPALLVKWQNDPQNAPGRLVSSPWPDRIEILSTKKLSKDAYEVKGEIIEITSTEEANGGIFGKRSITLTIKKMDDHWLIDGATLGSYEDVSSNIYHNTQFGFNFSLPNSWKNYTIVNDNWKGFAIKGDQGEKAVEVGPIISIRHPQWTSQNPRQDIPIMIFTLKQWESLQQDQFHIGAAPMGPTELGRNTKYIFALPARYNFAFPTGFEEVENILKDKPLQPIENN